MLNEQKGKKQTVVLATESHLRVLVLVLLRLLSELWFKFTVGSIKNIQIMKIILSIFFSMSTM